MAGTVYIQLFSLTQHQLLRFYAKCIQSMKEHMCVGRVGGSEKGRYVVRVKEGGPGLYQDYSPQAA